MKLKFYVLVSCLVSMLCLVGCNKGDGSFDWGNLFGSGSYSGTEGAGLSGGGEDGAGSDGADSDGGDNSSDAVGLAHHPEPATLGLLGSGLFAYAFLKRRKKK